MGDILTRRFRSNPRYELVPLADLPTAQRALFSSTQEPDSELYGVLRPRAQSGLTMKAVCANTAWLFRAMTDPGPLPADVVTALGPEARDDVAGLVLDGVLEIESDSDKPRFVTAASANEVLAETDTRGPGLGALARLSLDALKYAQDLGVPNALLLSGRLYFYNRIPASPAWLARLPTYAAVRRHLGIDGSTVTSRVLDRNWRPQSAGASADTWLLWRRDASGPARDARAGAFKLYVSCAATDLGEVFAAAADTATQTGAYGLKVGRDAYGLLRPDKLIAYFHDFDEILEAADTLRARIGGCVPHGVPFTAQLDERGLLSWGIDPPSGRKPLAITGRESWRLWVTNHLASSIVAAVTDERAAREPWQFALDRLAREGVDTHTWAPRDTIWNRQQEEA